MPTRYIRNTAILAKIEATYGVDPTPTGAANALLVSNASFDMNISNVDRSLIRSYMGAGEQLAGVRYGQLSFDVELSGSGTAGTAPAWGPILRACGMAEVITAATRVDYTPISTAFESVAIYYHLDGVLFKLLGCRGTVKAGLGMGDRPMLSFSFIGLDGGPAAAANPSLTLTAWKAPLVITDANTGDIKLGGTYAAGAISGGTVYTSRGLAIDLGCSVKHVPLLGGESVQITDRNTTGSLTLDLDAAGEVAQRAAINANTLTSISLEHGVAAGAKIIIFAPAAQRINPKTIDQDGAVMLGLDLRLTPLSGNDELRIVAL